MSHISGRRRGLHRTAITKKMLWSACGGLRDFRPLRSPARVEIMEARVLLSGSLSGVVYNDANHNGVQDNGEAGIAGVVVYQDPNYNHTLNSGEQHTITNAAGQYAFANPAADPEILRVVLPTGDTQSFPANNAGQYVGKNTGQTLAGLNFGLCSPTALTGGSLAGKVVDSNGKAVAGVVVYEDPNYNHKFDAGEQSTLTDINGNYLFTNLPADPEIVRIVPPIATQQLSPTGGAGQYVGKNSGANITGLNFEVSTPPTNLISGTVFNDLNHNGIKDAGEPGLAGVVVYGDANYNHKIDSGELHTVTDANGNYFFANVTTNPLIIRIVPPGSDIQTEPTGGGGEQLAEFGYYQVGGTVAGADFGLFIPTAGHNSTITGSVFNDENGNHVKDPGEVAFSGPVVYLDLNHDGKFDTGDVHTAALSDGTFSFIGLAPGTYSVGLDMVGVGPEALQTSPLSGDATVTIAAGQSVSAGTFGIDPTGGINSTSAAIGGIVYNDANRDGSEDYNESGLDGVTVYIDLHNTGTYAAGDPTAITNPLGEYTISSLPAGSYVVREIVPAGYTQLNPANNGGFSVSLSAGRDLSEFEFGLVKNA